MCLLAVFHKAHPESPLIVAANRDEMLARPATAMTVLSPSQPRVLGGRDELAGGTWLAVNERGLVAGLTNRPTPEGRDPAKRSRGELPLALARHPSASAAVEDFAREFKPEDFNPAWLLVADADALYYIDFTGAGKATAEKLPPGLHILENQPLHAKSPKADHVRKALAGAESLRGEALRERLWAVLRDHEIPPGVEKGDPRRPPETHAACVHAGPYGTRSAALIIASKKGGPPALWYTDGPSCVNPVRDAAPLWRAR